MKTINGAIPRFARDDAEVKTSLPAKAGGNVRWVIIGMICMVTVINYIDRQTLSVLAPMIRETFGMTNTAYSRVASADRCLRSCSRDFADTMAAWTRRRTAEVSNSCPP